LARAIPASIAGKISTPFSKRLIRFPLRIGGPNIWLIDRSNRPPPMPYRRGIRGLSFFSPAMQFLTNRVSRDATTAVAPSWISCGRVKTLEAILKRFHGQIAVR
jgi:hypothetical protein